MTGLGIDAVRQLVGDSNEEIRTRLEATSLLSKTAIWQLRHPIDLGGIFEGRELGRTLESHVSTFTQVTSVPADLVRHGVEPPLTVEARSLLFSIAHNALTNAFRFLVTLPASQTGRAPPACRCGTSASARLPRTG